MDELVSIVVPIYNAEGHLERTVNSLLVQTYHCLEIILIDDGSTDRSSEIITEIAQMDTRIIAVCQSNEGTSGARNAGLRIASGKYLMFVDADDELHAEAVMVMVKKAEENSCDLVMCGMMVEYKSGEPGMLKLAPFSSDRVMRRTEILTEVCNRLLYNEIFTSSCDKLYAKAFLDRGQLVFDEGIGIREDFFFNLDVFNCAERFLCLDNAFYKYSVSSTNTGRRIHHAFFDISVKLYEKKLKLAEKWGLLTFESNKKMAFDFLLDVIESIRQACLPGKDAELLVLRILNNPACSRMTHVLIETGLHGVDHSSWMLFRLIKGRHSKLLIKVFRCLERFHIKLKASIGTVNRQSKTQGTDDS